MNLEIIKCRDRRQFYLLNCDKMVVVAVDIAKTHTHSMQTYFTHIQMTRRMTNKMIKLPAKLILYCV